MKGIFITTLLFSFLFTSCSSNPNDKSNNSIDNEKPTLEGGCGYLTQKEVADVLGHQITDVNENSDDLNKTNTCTYYAGKDNKNNYTFAYVTFITKDLFQSTRGSIVIAVTGIGDDAFWFKGKEVEELWVLKGDKAFNIGISIQPNTEGCTKLSQLILTRLN